MIRVAINGYGRIGRLAHRILLEKYPSEAQVVAINAGSSTDISGWMYLLKYDTSYHALNSKFEIRNSKIAETNRNGILKDAIGQLIINNQEIPVFSQKDPALLPWEELKIDVVIEATGSLRKKEDLEKHIQSGAKRVILSAPEKGGGIPTYVLSVNDKNYANEEIISNASCTTNCIAPVAKVIHNAFGIEKAMMTTIHGYTSDQRLQDGGHKDYRRARAASENIIPTSTGATTAAVKTLPDLEGKFDGLAIRVPVSVGSLSDFTFLLKKETSIEEVNAALRKASESPEYRGILRVTTDPIVSSDVIGDSHSAIVDLSLTQVVDKNMVKVVAWYDNEYGYSHRLVEEVLMVTAHL